MRRNDKGITDPGELETIIRSGRICRLALTADPAPYIVPLNYGYRDGVLYFHSAPEGRKLELMRRNPWAGFEIDLDLGLRDGGAEACKWSMRYRSVIGYGQIEFISGSEEKRRALDLIMAQYTPGEFTYPDAMMQKTTSYKLIIEQLTGKGTRD